jgi:tetratricopeptide (TPR) repeat protein
MGSACREAGDDARARPFFEQATDLAPGDRESLQALRSLYTREKRWDGVARAIERLVECTSREPARAALATELGEVLEERFQEGARAETWYARAITFDPGCRPAHARLGRRCFAAGDFGPAREHLAAALAIEGPPEAREEAAALAFELGVSCCRLGETDEGIRAFRQAVRIQPDRIDAWEELGRLYLEAAEWRSAAEALRVVSAAEGLTGPRRADALFGLAVAERSVGAFDAGLEAVDQALAGGPDRYAWRMLRAELLSELDRPEEAAAAWRDAAGATEDPGLIADAFYRGGAILEALPGRRAEGIPWLEEALAADPKHAPSLRRLADHAMETGAWEEAQTSLERLCELRETAQDHADLARVWWEGFGREHHALGHLRSALALDPTRLDALNLVVDVCTDREEWGQLTEVVEGALEGQTLLPEHAGLLRRLAEVHAERLYQPDRASFALRALVDLSPDDLDAREALAAALSKSAESYADAVAAYRRVLEDSPLRASAWRGMAGVFWFQRRLDACSVVAQALRVIGSETEEGWMAASRQGAPWRPDRDRWRDAFTPGGAGRAAADEPTLLEPIKTALGEAWQMMTPSAAREGGAWLGARQKALEEARVLWGLPSLMAVPHEEGVRLFGGQGIAIGIHRDWVRETADPVWRFLCHRAAAQIALGHGPAGGLDPPSLRALLAALRQASGMTEGERVAGAEAFLPAAEQAVGWLNRRKIRKALIEIGNPSDGEIESALAGLARSAERVALVACGDLGAAVAAVGALERGIPGIDPMKDPLAPLLEISPAARDLLVFAAGEGYLSAREAVAAPSLSGASTAAAEEVQDQRREAPVRDPPPSDLA